ncbi:MAG: TonB-dependent receptor [Sphingobacteriaceae bacterium]|nr:MAG: TonB-dependent receptor [Sphingobacteriaceae bacterium]
MIPKKASRIIIALTVVLCIAFSSFVNLDDDPVVVKIVTQLHQWLSANPTEKVYLQLDKPYYAAGDNIWFKAYVTANNKPSALSGILNVELIDGRDSVKRHIKLELNNGIAWGDFILPDTLQAGNYRLVAYTNWMRNAGAEYYFDKTIAVGNTNKPHHITQAQKNNSNTADVQFFPESGSLVNGLRSKVAIKVVGPNGLGIDVTGTIIDNQNNTVSNITTTHLGMGIFALTPQNGKTYKALLTYPNGLKSTVNLPPALNSGYVLTINSADTENINVKVAASPNMPNAGKFYIIAQSAGQAQFIADNKSNGNSFSMTVPKSKFPSGIVQFTLFSSTGQPLNERVVFIQHQADLLQLDITANKKTSTIREPYKFDFTAKTNDGKPVAGNFSVSVVDDSKVPDNATDQTTILSHLLLTSDLRGYIENPAYYFENINETTRANLDVLMLTQGYRRFNWKPLLAGETAPPKFEVENAIEISGKVISNYGKKPVANAKIALFSRAGMFYMDTLADQQGRFTFRNLMISDSVSLILQARTPKDGTYVTVVLDDNKYQRKEALVKKVTPQNYSPDDFITYLASSKALFDQEIKDGIGNHSILLKQVEVKDKIKKPVLSYSANILGPGNADQVFTNEMIYKYGPGHLEDFLRTRVNGIIFHEGSPRTSRIIDSLGNPAKMLILVNGVENNSIADLMTSDVGSVEILKAGYHAAIYGPRGRNGVLLINLKTGIDAMNNLPKNTTLDVIKLTPKGYYTSREFYSPKYDDPKTNKDLADLRTTIYWNPNITTDNTGHASFKYYNAGTPGTYRVVIEGMDAEGRLGREIFRYKITAE